MPMAFGNHKIMRKPSTYLDVRLIETQVNPMKVKLTRSQFQTIIDALASYNTTHADQIVYEIVNFSTHDEYEHEEQLILSDDIESAIARAVSKHRELAGMTQASLTDLDVSKFDNSLTNIEPNNHAI